MSGGKSMAAPDYMGIMQEQARIGRPNVNTPYGSYTWSSQQGGGGAPDMGTVPPDEQRIFQASGGGAGGGGPYGPVQGTGRGTPDNTGAPAANPSGSAWPPGGSGGGGGGAGGGYGGDIPNQLDVTLDPAEQALLDQRRQLGSGMNQAALDMLGAGISGQGAQDALYGQFSSRADPRFQQAENQLRTRLYNTGLREGDAAFDQQMQQFGQGREDAYRQATFDSILRGEQSMGNQINMINALRGGGRVQDPNFPGGAMGQTPDLLGAYNASLAYGQQNNPLALLGALFGI